MTAHGEALRTETHDDPFVEGIKQDYTAVRFAGGGAGDVGLRRKADRRAVDGE